MKNKKACFFEFKSGNKKRKRKNNKPKIKSIKKYRKFILYKFFIY